VSTARARDAAKPRARGPGTREAHDGAARPEHIGAVVVTCEHASRTVPAPARRALAPVAHLLATHRGYDAGARDLARELAEAVRAPLHLARATRLAIDLNRSLERMGAYSPWTRALDGDARAQLADELWHPFRAAVRADLDRKLATHAPPVLHLSVHSFTPVLRGKSREIDVALLYDPRRPRERAFVDRWLAALARVRPDLRLRRNAPYRGDADGHTTALRRAFPPARYLGIELEISQRFPRQGGTAWKRLRRDLTATLREVTGA
jgi:predicted N-formylglutamate amidohydrolase